MSQRTAHVESKNYLICSVGTRTLTAPMMKWQQQQQQQFNSISHVNALHQQPSGQLYTYTECRERKKEQY